MGVLCLPKETADDGIPELKEKSAGETFQAKQHLWRQKVQVNMDQD